MSERIKIQFTPGGINSDASPNQIGYSEWQEVKNLRLNKDGEWTHDKGYASINSNVANVLSGIEITDDLTSERFIIYHAGTSLYRLNYSGGYSGQTPSALTLPTGVTILITDKLKYRWNNGVLRIMGGSHPLRYEYVNRTLFEDSIELIDRDTFASTVEGWVGYQATVSVFSGVLVVVKTATGGCAYKDFTIAIGQKYRVRLYSFSIYQTKMLVGTAQDSDLYGTSTIDAPVNSEPKTHEIEFTATTTDLRVVYDPAVGQVQTGQMDEFKIEIFRKLTISGWKLTKAAVLNPESSFLKAFNPIFNGTTKRAVLLKGFWIFDGHQYSLPFTLNHMTPFSGISYSGKFDYASALISVDYNVFTNPRITGLGIIAEITTIGVDGVYTRYVTEIIDFRSQIDDVIFHYDKFSVHPSDAKELFLEDSNNDMVVMPQACRMIPGSVVTLENDTAKIKFEILGCTIAYVTAPTYNVGMRMTRITSAVPLTALEQDVNQNLLTTKATVNRQWHYWNYDYPISGVACQISGAYYSTWVFLDFTGGSPEYHDLTTIPAGTSSIEYDYSDLQIIDNRAFALSEQDDGGDVVRYSPIMQPDVFPSLNYLQTEIGDRDANKAIAAINDRLVILKSRSISRVGAYGNQMDMDIRFAERGMYPLNGLIVVDNLLYFMDHDDVYVFDGTSITPWLRNERVRKLYQGGVGVSSFFLYNKLENELWLGLTGFIMVFSFSDQKWTKRIYPDSPVASFLDADDHMIGIWEGATTNFKDFNHSGTTNPSSMEVRFRTRLIDTENPEQFKKVVRLVLYAKGNQTLQVRVTDLDSNTYSSTTITPSTTLVTAKEATAIKKLFRNAEIEVYASASNIDMQIRGLMMEVQKWR